MKEIEKVSAKIKFKAEDFIVEEIGNGWECSVLSGGFNEYPDISKLDLLTPKDFLWCEFEKIDIDHFQAIKELSIRIGKYSSDIGYAGTKDKRAHTSQRISIFRPDLSLISKFKHPKILLKNFKWEKRKIKLGYLEGNRFKITLRDIDKKDAIKISSRIRGVSFFPNYFGQQRFGSQKGNNVKIGIFLLKRKFREAVWEILTASGDEWDDFKAARERFVSEGDFGNALSYFPSKLRNEREVLYYLSKNPEDYIGALKRVDRKNLLMYVHSVQSFIFNEILRRALEERLDFTKKGQQNCILAGYKTKFSSGRLGEIEKEVLDENNIELEDFNIEDISFLRIKGSFRKAIVEVRNLHVDTSDDDEFSSSKKIYLEFELPSGVYATIFLDSFFDFS
jgi:tRNA pseudouridine13 synthase